MPEHLEKADDGHRRGPVAARSLRQAPAVEAGAGLGRPALSAAGVLALQRSVGNVGTTAFLQREEEGRSGADGGRSPVHDVVGRGGSPLDNGTRSTMEAHLGRSLSDVRLHVDAKSTESVKAAAFTVGKDVVVHPDHYSPGTPQTQRTLAHELTHVKQQSDGPVAGTPQAGGIQVSDPSDRFEREAERSADSVMASTQRMAAVDHEDEAT